MPLRRCTVTPAALRARRLNSLKSTGPRSARGKAWSCLNALHHGQRWAGLRTKPECYSKQEAYENIAPIADWPRSSAPRRRTFRDRLVRTGDSEAVYLLDFIFEELLSEQESPSDFVWRRLESLAVCAWCIESGRRGRKVAKSCPRTKLESGLPIYRYAANLVVPRRLKIANKLGWGFILVNPAPSRRRRLASSWIPEVQQIEGKPPKARRVRGGCKPGTEIIPRPSMDPVLFTAGRGGSRTAPTTASVESRWGAICKAVGRIGSSIFQRLGVSTRSAVPAVSSPPKQAARFDRGSLTPATDSWSLAPEVDWDDPEDYESESAEEFLFRHKFLARLAMAAARRSRTGSG